uniref:hypothetical protein n=1 Tax=Vaginimicrobium propionicum TaxID=1871034 RepID=UPI0012EC33E6|nr:hypothetical protein [Vaginimicrobium propionicum]
MRRWNKHRTVLGSLVDAELSRLRLEKIQASGVSLEAAAGTSGISTRTLKRIITGQAQRVQRATQAAIMQLSCRQIREYDREFSAEPYRNRVKNI